MTSVLRTLAPASVATRLRRLFSGHPGGRSRYDAIRLTAVDIDRGAYKMHLGGGAESWEQRGAFQLVFLRQMGLRPDHALFDVGCGPGRAARYFIEYLADGKYHGVDYNADFIKAAEIMADRHALLGKRPRFDTVADFDFAAVPRRFDYAIVFSVINHCTPAQTAAFFEQMHRPMNRGGKVYVSHASWFQPEHLTGSRLELTGRFGPGDFDIAAYGWRDGETIFPILELTHV